MCKKINRKVAFFIWYSRTRVKILMSPTLPPPYFLSPFLKLLSPTLPKLMNWKLLSPPPLSSDPDNPPKFGTCTEASPREVITWQVKPVDLRYYEWFNTFTRFQSIQKSALILEGTKRKDPYGVAAWEVTSDAICGKLSPDTMSGLIRVLALKSIQTQN